MAADTRLDQSPDWRARIRQSRLGTVAVLGLTTLIVVLGAYLLGRPDTDGITAVDLTGPRAGPPPAIGQPAQDFSATTVDGQQVSLSDYRGQPVWLTFGASWCASCRAEFPDIQEAHQRAQADGVVVIAVYLSQDSAEVRDYADRLGLTFVQLADPDTRIASAYRVLGVPAHYFIDRSGILHSIQAGVLTPAHMDATLSEISR